MEPIISSKEADFRTYLCDSGATDEIVRLLVGLAEAPERPEEPHGFSQLLGPPSVPSVLQQHARRCFGAGPSSPSSEGAFGF